jgi:preprotein translocase subunit YajC
VQGLLIIVLLFGAMYFLMIRPQRAKAQAQARLLNAVEVGDEILTVGGVYGIVQEIEPDEDGGDLVVEIAEGIHVRIARKGLATVVKPEDDDEEDAEDVDEDDEDDDDVIDGEAEIVEDAAELSPGGVVEVNGEQVSVNPGAAEGTAPPERS